MKIIIGLSLILLSGVLAAPPPGGPPRLPPPGAPLLNSTKDSITSVKAFMAVYEVLMSPRCMNCHPSGDAPLQGDDSHPHTMNVMRGPDGRGLYAMKCSNCHQPENTAGMHTPPGNPKWRLPPADTPMVFQGRTPGQLARQLLDPKRNGGRTIGQLYEHMAKDDLVGWGWRPGEGRTRPPMSRPAFAAQVKIWLENGAFAPREFTKKSTN